MPRCFMPKKSGLGRHTLLPYNTSSFKARTPSPPIQKECNLSDIVPPYSPSDSNLVIVSEEQTDSEQSSHRNAEQDPLDLHVPASPTTSPQYYALDLVRPENEHNHNNSTPVIYTPQSTQYSSYDGTFHNTSQPSLGGFENAVEVHIPEVPYRDIVRPSPLHPQQAYHYSKFTFPYNGK